MNEIQRKVVNDVVHKYLLNTNLQSDILCGFSSADIAKLRDALSVELLEREKENVRLARYEEQIKEAVERYQVEAIKAVAHLNGGLDSLAIEASNSEDAPLTNKTSDYFDDTLVNLYKAAEKLTCGTSPTKPIDRKDDPSFVSVIHITSLLRIIALRIENTASPLNSDEIIEIYESLHNSLVRVQDEISLNSHNLERSRKQMRELELWVDMALELIKTQLNSQDVLKPEVVDKVLRKRTMIGVEGERTVNEGALKSSFKGYTFRAVINGELKRWNGVGKPPSWLKELQK
jgi:hypothetical protein